MRTSSKNLIAAAALTGMGAMALLSASGCGTSQRAAPRPIVGAGASWASVMDTPELARLADQDVNQDANPITSRRDADLQPYENRLASATDQWPRPARPSLYRDRYFRVSNPHSNGFIYYGSGGSSDYYESRSRSYSESHYSTYQSSGYRQRTGVRGWP